MPRIRLIHSNASEAKEKARKLREAGYQVAWEPLTGPDSARKLKARLPAAYVIDLSRVPSFGRDVGIFLRHTKATRHVPLVFVDGDPAKVTPLKKKLPDAVFTPWSRIRGALKAALSRPVADPVVPGSPMDGYSGVPLPRKLGIKAGMTVALAGAPAGFERTLGALPEDVTLRRRAAGRPDLVLWFTDSKKELLQKIRKMGALAGKGAIWIAWPKQASGVKTDLTQATVRREGLATGLVDYKICAIDKTWSGLKFTRRKSR
jgi:hypothetical protein